MKSKKQTRSPLLICTDRRGISSIGDNLTESLLMREDMGQSLDIWGQYKEKCYRIIGIAQTVVGIKATLSYEG